MDTPNNLIYTLGHSNHTIDFFRELIEKFKINCVIDVRTVAASAYNPQFNKEPLLNYLKRYNISYLHFAEEFGARHVEKELLDDEGKVDFDKVRKSKKFLLGVERLKDILRKGFTIALMCSEADPFDCHRFSLISYHLVKSGFSVKHILKDKTVIDNAKLESSLLEKYSKKISRPSLFNQNISDADRINEAYKLKNKQIAYDTLNI